MWVESMEKKLDGAEPMATTEKWRKHCIFRVPPHFKVGRGNVFKPQTVALGPFHHGDPNLRPMEEHKLRAVLHVLRRAGDRQLRELAAAVEEVAGDLEDAYAGLGPEWRGKEENRGRFLEMMIADGCFLLEVIRENSKDYDRDDPVFGEHARRHIATFVHCDMLMIENQLPLVLLQRIVAFESGQLPDEPSINNIVINFLRKDGWCATEVGPRLGFHPLDLYRRSLLQHSPSITSPSPADREDQIAYRGFRTIGATRANQQATRRACCNSLCLLPTRTETRAGPHFRGASVEETAAQGGRSPPPRSAKRLWNSGIRFRPSKTSCLDDIHFNRCTRRLEMPRIVLDDSTECKFSNLMAFEALHAGAGNGVTAFVMFMRDMVDSADDVAALRDGKVLEHDLAGSDTAVVRLLNRLTKDVAKFGDINNLWSVQRDEVDDYCKREKWGRVFVFKSWAKLRRSHLSSPWAFIALVFSLLLVGTDITQTVFAVKSYAHEIWKDSRERAPAPQVARWTGH